MLRIYIKHMMSDYIYLLVTPNLSHGVLTVIFKH